MTEQAPAGAARPCPALYIHYRLHRPIFSHFGILIPTEIFLGAVGLPVEDGEMFVSWVEATFAGFFDLDRTAADQAAAAVTGYFEAAVADREKSPRDADTDFVSYLLAATIDG